MSIAGPHYAQYKVKVSFTVPSSMDGDKFYKLYVTPQQMYAVQGGNVAMLADRILCGGGVPIDAAACKILYSKERDFPDSWPYRLVIEDMPGAWRTLHEFRLDVNDAGQHMICMRKMRVYN